MHPTPHSYLGLGGLSADRPPALLDLRGTGASGGVDDAASCRCDRIVDDVEALRRHLAARVAELFPRGDLVVQPGAGHFPWHDDPTAFQRVVAAFG